MRILAAWTLLALAPWSCLAQAAAAKEPLVVEDMRCRGNALTSCDFILGHIYLSPGDALNETELQNAQLRLTTLRTFESVGIRLERGSERGKAIVVVEVTESEPLMSEWLLGASHRLDAFRIPFAGRLTHQNLFGTGKIADFSVTAVTPISWPKEEVHAAALRYADPHFLGSKRYFAIASASYIDVTTEGEYGDFLDAEVLRFGFAVGRRLWDFSYLTVGYGFRPRLHVQSGHWNDDGIFELDEETSRHVMDFIYGWNSEDDLYFPTRGSTFHIGGGFDFGGDDDYDILLLQFRKTWQTENGFWTLKVGGDPSPEYRQSFSESQVLAISYARALAPNDSLKRGRWYIEPGFNGAGNDPNGDSRYELGLKIGVRLETEAFGLIELYVIGSANPGSGD